MKQDAEREGNPEDALRAEVEASQRNILWPHTMINGSKVDAVLWKGAPSAPVVQRVGIAIFGLFFLGAGLGIAFGLGEGLLGFLVGVAFASVGVKLLYNAVWISRRHASASTLLDEEDEV